jgi:hypothetical protein
MAGSSLSSRAPDYRKKHAPAGARISDIVGTAGPILANVLNNKALLLQQLNRTSEAEAKVRAVETVSKPAMHLRLTVDTENGPLGLQVSISAAHELRAMLAQLPSNPDFLSPVVKL